MSCGPNGGASGDLHQLEEGGRRGEGRERRRRRGGGREGWRSGREGRWCQWVREGEEMNERGWGGSKRVCVGGEGVYRKEVRMEQG